MSEKHELKLISEKPRKVYICTKCYLKFAIESTSPCFPNDKAVPSRKERYYNPQTNNFLFYAKKAKKS